MINSVSVTITGADTGYLGTRLRGRIVAIKCVANTNANPTIVVSGETSGVAILTIANVTKDATTWWYPRAFPNQATDGAAETGAECDIYVLNERISAVTSVAATGTVALTVYYDSEE